MIAKVLQVRLFALKGVETPKKEYPLRIWFFIWREAPIL